MTLCERDHLQFKAQMYDLDCKLVVIVAAALAAAVTLNQPCVDR
jgi:hypothetical protein